MRTSPHPPASSADTEFVTVRPRRLPGVYATYPDVVIDADITDRAFHLYGLLDEYGVEPVTVAELAAKTKFTQTNVRRAIQELVDHQFVGEPS